MDGRIGRVALDVLQLGRRDAGMPFGPVIHGQPEQEPHEAHRPGHIERRGASPTSACRQSAALRNAAAMMPMLLPALKMPVDMALSLVGCHMPTVLIAPGKLPPSARPNAKRARAESGDRKDCRRETAQESSGQHGVQPRQARVDQRMDQAVRHGREAPEGHRQGETLALAEPVHHPSGQRVADGIGQRERADDEAEVTFRPTELFGESRPEEAEDLVDRRS